MHIYVLHIYVHSTYLETYLTTENIIVTVIIIFRIVVDAKGILRTWKFFSSIKQSQKWYAGL